MHYAVSAIVASQVSTLNNFILTELWVFRGREARRHIVVRYLTFNALNVATLAVRVPLLVLITEWIGLHYLVSNVIAIGVTFGIRYFIADNWIWAGRDARDQSAADGWFHYDIHGLARLSSRIALPELAAFNTPDARRAGHRHRPALRPGWPAAAARQHRLRGRRHPLPGAVGRGRRGLRRPPGRRTSGSSRTGCWPGRTMSCTRTWWSRSSASCWSAAAWCCCIARRSTPSGAHLLMSAQTDTGKTSTLLRLLMHRPWGFMGDDMAIVRPDGQVLSYPKPMTLSLHTMSAVNESALPFADRFMLAIRSRVHSKQSRSIGHALGRWPVPIVTINSVVQLLVPPPKYHVTSLLDCDMVDESPLDGVLLMERGQPVIEDVALEPALDELLANTEDAYTFPPFGWFAPYLVFDGLGVDALRARERDLLRSAVARGWRTRLRVVGHEWAEVIPTLLDGRASARQPCCQSTHRPAWSSAVS